MKLHRTNQISDFISGSFSNRDNVNEKEKDKTSILKDDFLSRTKPSIFTSIAPQLFERRKKTCPTPVQCFMSQIRVQNLIVAPTTPVQCFVGKIRAQKLILAITTSQTPDHI